MKDKEFEMLTESIKEAAEIKANRKNPSRVFEMNAPEIKKIRETLHVSQSEFALMIGVSVRTLQNWEQGRRKPEGPARILLSVAAKHPEAILDSVHQ